MVIFTFKKYKISQKSIDEWIYGVLWEFLDENNIKISQIRSGGQSGADEAGLKAAEN